MAENIEEQETATEEEEQFLRKYAFDCEGCGAVSTESPELIVPPPGIQVIFIRYGLIKEDNSTHPFIWPPQKDPTRMAPEGAPSINGYKYVRTSLRPEGWVYIFKESTQKFERIDIHHLSLRFQYTLKKGETIWAAYSEIRWTESYEDCMVKDANKRARRMQKIAFDDWYYQQEHADGCDIDDIDAVFNTDLESYIFQNKYENVLNYEDDPDRKEYMFFCLHDPIDVANQLAYNLQDQWNQMDALLISIKLGVPLDQVVTCLQKGKEPESLQTPDQEPEQIAALFNIASTLRAIAFTDEDAKEKIGNHLDKYRIDAVLGTKERLQQRDYIQKARLLLKEFLVDTYYTDLLDEYKENGEEVLLDAKYFVAKNFLILIAPLPNSKDAFMDTPDEACEWHPEGDTCQQFVHDVLKRKNEIGKLYDEGSLIDALEDFANFLKLAGIMDTLMDAAGQLPSLGPDYLKVLKKLFNRTRIKIGEETIDEIMEVKTLSSKFRKSDHPLSEIGCQLLGINKKSIAAFEKVSRNYHGKFEKWMYVNQLSFTRKFEKAVIQNASLLKIGGFQQGIIWSKFIRNVNILNLIIAGTAMKNTTNGYEFGLSLSKVVVASADAYTAHRGVKQFAMQARKLDEEIINSFKRGTRKWTIGVSYAGVVVDTAEAAYNFWQRDYDAALAYSGAAIFGSFSLYAFSAALASTGAALIWNPIGWAAFLAAAGLGIWASFLEDGPMEQYAKHCIFRKITPRFNIGMGIWLENSQAKFSGNYLNQIQQHVERKNFIGENDWSDYPTGYRALLDVLFAGRIILRRGEHRIVRQTLGGGKHSETINSTYKIFAMTAEILFANGVHDEDSLDTLIYFCPKGLGAGGYQPLEDIYKKLEHEVGKPPKAIVSFNIPAAHDENVHKDAVVVVMCRLKLNDEYWLPTVGKENARYLASKLGVFLTDKSATYYKKITKESYSAIKVDTKNNILQGKKSWWLF